MNDFRTCTILEHWKIYTETTNSITGEGILASFDILVEQFIYLVSSISVSLSLFKRYVCCETNFCNVMFYGDDIL